MSKWRFFAQEFHQLPQEYFNAYDVIAFCLYLMNKMRRNLRKIRSCAIYRWMMSLPFVFISWVKYAGISLFSLLWKGGISYIPGCIAFYYIIKIPNARDPISSTGTWQLNNGEKRLVLPIKPSVRSLLCRSIYDFRFTIPSISLVKSK